ncbi:MAG: sugar transferase, partial [Ruegeria sp.]
FSQVRAGRNGQKFLLTKLRSMTNERDASGDLLPDKKRQTSFTRIVRRLRLDEVPQLISILRGNMALIGPRPLMPETIDEFGELGRLRCAIRPGLTGWAQVSGNTNLSNPEKLHLDLWYAAHRSTALDFRIMAETIAVAIRGEHRREDRIGQAERWVTHADPQQIQGSMA